jgi:hypothetical protein
MKGMTGSSLTLTFEEGVPGVPPGMFGVDETPATEIGH